MSFTDLASSEMVEITVAALQANGITAELVADAAAAKAKVLSIIPKGSEVMTMTSITLEQTGLVEALNESTEYISIKKKLEEMNSQTHAAEKQQLGAAPNWAVGSVHAITQDGIVMIASNTGSQLPAYAYGATHVIWVVSTKKIVSSQEEGMRRIQEHIVPLESVRARKAYGLPDTWDTYPSKILTVQREVNPERLRVIFVQADVGF